MRRILLKCVAKINNRQLVGAFELWVELWETAKEAADQEGRQERVINKILNKMMNKVTRCRLTL